MTDSSDLKTTSGGEGGTHGDLPRHVLDNLLEGCQVINRDFRYLYVNEAVAVHGRTTREELLGRTMMEAYPGIEDTEMFSVLRRCMEEQAPQLMENEFTFPDGSKGWFELRFEPVPEGVSILSMDITRRKQGEEALRRATRALTVLSQCNQTLIRAADERSFMDDICRIITDSGGYRMAWIGMKDGAGDDPVRPVASAGLNGSHADLARKVGDELELDNGPAGRAVRSGQPTVVRSIATDPELATYRAAALKLGYASCIALPFGEDAETIGALMIYAAEPDAFDGAERRLLEEMALDLGHGVATLRARVERRRAMEALRHSEIRARLFRELVDQSSDAIEVLDPDTGQILEVNETGCRDMGYSREEYCALTAFDVDPMLDPATFGEAARNIREGEVMLWEGVHRRKDGTEFPVEVSITHVLLDREYMVAAVRDVTQRREVEQALRRNRDSQEAIASILRLSLEEVQLDELLSQVLHTVLSVPWLSIERKGAILLVEQDPAVLVMRAEEGLPDELKERCARVPFGWCLCGRAAETGEVIHAEDLDARHDTTYCEIVPHGHYCVPIAHPGRMLGVLNAYVAPGHAYAQQEVDFLTDAANTLAGIIARRRAEAEQRRIEEQLKQAQRLEAIGRLAGGVAHDFNNLLTVINSYASFAIDALHEPDPVRTDIVEIRSAGKRAEALTRQLLAFSRKQVLQPEVLDLNQVVGDIERMLRRLLGEDIHIVVHLAEGLGRVEADRGQLEQVVMNLAVNARDAMPQGGKLTIDTANVELDSEYARHHVSVEPGRFVQLAITDTGTGMDETTLNRVFEPFFTTKVKGKGTGLGLSTVYGIVKQSGGNIWVNSEPGRGTTFKVYLPRKDAPVAEVKRKPVSALLKGIETVLVVEDEDAVRSLVERILRGAGYRVLAAANGDEALARVEGHRGKIHLLLTDVVMPEMSGRQLGERLSERNPKLKMLYMSGYTDNAIVHHGVLDPGTRFIGKPFSPVDLARKVREVLDED